MTIRTNFQIQQETALRFRPTILLPHYLENCSLGRNGDPAKRLMMAILNEALKDFEDNVFTKQRSGRSLYGQAKDWIFDETEEWLFSFNSICRRLGFDPNYLRCQLLRVSARKLRRSTLTAKTGTSPIRTLYSGLPDKGPAGPPDDSPFTR